MSETVIKIENLSKRYRLGLVGTNTLKGDLQSWWYRIRGKEDPTLKIGEENRLTEKGGEYVWALKDINLEVKQGEILGIIGKNGAGKSTLLKILSRVTGPTKGSIKTKGRLASLLEVGTGFHGELTGRENIYLNGAILGMTKTEINKQFDEIVDFAGIEKYIDTPVKRYSSGMYVRLGFAVAAHLSSEILVVDEVLAVGDAEFQKKAIGKMQDISSGGGRTVLFVSHNMASVQKLCTRGILLENGGISKTGTTSDIISYYLRKNESIFSTKKFIDKGGNKKAIIIDYYPLKKEKKNFIFFVGEQFKINIKIKFNDYLDNIDLGINFRNTNNELITHITNLDSSFTIFSEKNSIIEFSAIIEKIYLSPGIYTIDIGLVSNGELVHILENCFEIELLKSSEIGRPNSFPKHVKVFTPSIWLSHKI